MDTSQYGVPLMPAIDADGGDEKQSTAQNPTVPKSRETTDSRPMQTNIPTSAGESGSSSHPVDLDNAFEIVTGTNQNKCSLLCRFCSAKIMSEKVAVYVRQTPPGTYLPGFVTKKKITETNLLPEAGSTETSQHIGNPLRDGACYTQFWTVNDMFAFDNVGFTHAIPAHTGNSDTERASGAEIQRRYLLCGDCEMGPIGYRDEHKQQEIFVACDRVKYNE